MYFVFEFFDCLKFFGVIELGVLDLLKLFTEFFNRLVLGSEYFLVGLFCFLVPVLLVQNMSGQPVELLFGHLDFFIDEVVGLFILPFVFGVKLLDFSEFEFDELGAGCFGLNVLD